MNSPDNVIKALSAQRDELAREIARLEATIRRTKWKMNGLSEAIININEQLKVKGTA